MRKRMAHRDALSISFYLAGIATFLAAFFASTLWALAIDCWALTSS